MGRFMLSTLWLVFITIVTNIIIWSNSSFIGPIVNIAGMQKNSVIRKTLSIATLN